MFWVLSAKEKTFNWFWKYFLLGKLNCGVPQRSVFEQLLFFLCINDLPQSLSKTGFFLYEDLTYKHGTLEYFGCYLESKLSVEAMALQVLKL